MRNLYNERGGKVSYLHMLLIIYIFTTQKIKVFFRTLFFWLSIFFVNIYVCVSKCLKLFKESRECVCCWGVIPRFYWLSINSKKWVILISYVRDLSCNYLIHMLLLRAAAYTLKSSGNIYNLGSFYFVPQLFI